MNRDKYIFDRLKEHYNHLVEKGYDIVCLTLQGSQNYNLDTYGPDYTSDIDSKAIVLPNLNDIAHNRSPISTTLIMENEEHIDVKDIRIMGRNTQGVRTIKLTSDDSVSDLVRMEKESEN